MAVLHYFLCYLIVERFRSFLNHKNVSLVDILDKLQPGRRVPARRSAWHLPYIVFLERRGNDLIALNPVTEDSVTLSPESLLATDWEYC